VAILPSASVRRSGADPLLWLALLGLSGFGAADALYDIGDFP
jgi:hypothetical protein